MSEFNRLAPDALRLYKIDATRAHEEVVDQIVYAIRSGLLQSGDRLPIIEELAEATGVSKPVIGEAVRVLREHGVVASKRGVQGGVTVITDDVPIELLAARGWRKAHLTELVEARRPIETMLSLLAGERATEDDLSEMRETIGLLEDAARRLDSSFLHFDHRFHYQVARAARSEMLAFYQHRILSPIAAALEEYGLFHEDRDLVISTHRELFSAIEARDADWIRRAAEHHFTTSDGSFASIEHLITDSGS